jgi:hypothetical protein
MKRLILAGLACVLLGTSVNAHSVFVGTWESLLDGDNRQFRIVEANDGLKMTAPDLSCHFKVARTQKEQQGQIQVKTVCADEGGVTYGLGQIKEFKCNYLVIAETIYRRTNYDSKEEKLKKPELFVQLYRNTSASASPGCVPGKE